MTEKTYPPLPPSRYETTREIDDINTYTAAQMHAYYDLGRDMQAQAATPARRTAGRCTGCCAVSVAASQILLNREWRRHMRNAGDQSSGSNAGMARTRGCGNVL